MEESERPHIAGNVREGKQGLLFVAVHGLLIAVVFPVVARGLQVHGLR